ncbi:unnamed protein product, partial [Closterium sp. NIES-54]
NGMTGNGMTGKGGGGGCGEQGRAGLVYLFPWRMPSTARALRCVSQVGLWWVAWQARVVVVVAYGAESEGKPATVTFTRCTFQGNRAALGGGAIYSGLSVGMRMDGSRIEENESAGTGGGILIQEFSKVTMTNCDCVNN